MTEAACRKASAEAMDASKSFASRRFRLSQANRGSTTQRRGCTAKPTCSGCLRTISMVIEVASAATRSLPGAVGESEFNEREGLSRGLQQRHRAVAVLGCGGVSLQHELAPVGVDHGVPLRPLIFFPAS